MAPGRLITIEGIDGAGKSTLADSLLRELSTRGLPVELLRDPGGVETSERIRALVKDRELAFSPRTEVLLYAAARAQLIEQLIEPLLSAGAVVLLDRFVDSSLAYQGVGRGLGLEAVRAINRFATGSIAPDRTLLLRISPAEGRQRQRQRSGTVDRLEGEGEAFYAAIASGYEQLAHAEPKRIRVLDATLPPAEVLQAALAALTDLLDSSSHSD